MAWDATDLADYNDIILQDGVFAYNFTASGTIYKGQAVCVCADNKVMTCNNGGGTATEADAIGIACYNATNGNQIAVAGPGNIVIAVFDTDSDCTPGAVVYGDADGILDHAAGNASKAAGYVVSTPVSATTNYVGKLLVV